MFKMHYLDISYLSKVFNFMSKALSTNLSDEQFMLYFGCEVLNINEYIYLEFITQTRSHQYND